MRDINLSEWGGEITWALLANSTYAVFINGIRVTEDTRVINERGLVMAVDRGPFNVDTNTATNEMLTSLEHEAMDMTVDLWNMLNKIVGDDGRRSDLGELCGYIHSIQRAIMAQAACRAYPDRYRLLGAGPLQTGTDNG